MKSTTGLIGYAQPWVVHAGGTIEIKISSIGPGSCDLSTYRVVCADIDPGGPGACFERQDWGHAEALNVRHQHINAGSWAQAETVPVTGPDEGFVLSLSIFPTLRSDRPQVVFSFGGISLRLTSSGCLAATAGGDIVTCEVPLELRQWYVVELQVDANTLRLTLTRKRPGAGGPAHQSAAADIAKFDWPGRTTPLLFSAEPDDRAGKRFSTRHHYNGKIESPRISTACGNLLAGWDFSRNQSVATVPGLAPSHGVLALHNTPMRGATGQYWDGSAEHWKVRREHYAAIHFHEDDMTNCAWDTNCTLTVPAGTRPGYYVARLSARGVESDVSFFVSSKVGKPGSDILFLAPTATYLAYSNTHIKFDSANTENLYEAPMVLSEDELYLNEHRELGLSLYDTHSDGSGVVYSGSRRPMLNVRPGLYTFNYVNDTHILKWLETKGFDYDVATDEDLHRHGQDLLQPYRVLITVSHPEYCSTRMWDAIDDFQRAGGRHMYLGGNGFYWRIAWSDAHPGIIENRRGISGVRTWEGEPGEHTLNFTGEPGGLWRSHGRAPQRLVGTGFSSTLFVRSCWFRRQHDGTRPYEFVFAGLESDVIGNFGYRGGGCVGLEIDRWDIDLGSPSNAVILATSEGVDEGGLLSGEEYITTTRALDGSQNPDVRADMVAFSTDGGGAVWSAGSIAWATSLMWNDADNSVSRVTENVLRHFLNHPFPETAGYPNT